MSPGRHTVLRPFIPKPKIFRNPRYSETQDANGPAGFCRLVTKFYLFQIGSNYIDCASPENDQLGLPIFFCCSTGSIASSFVVFEPIARVLAPISPRKLTLNRQCKSPDIVQNYPIRPRLQAPSPHPRSPSSWRQQTRHPELFRTLHRLG